VAANTGFGSLIRMNVARGYALKDTAMADDDALVKRLCVSVSKQWESLTNRTWMLKDLTEIRDGNGRSYMITNEAPVVNGTPGTPLEVYDKGASFNFASTDLIDSSDIVLFADEGRIEYDGVFTAQRRAVKIIYSAGYNTSGWDNDGTTSKAYIADSAWTVPMEVEEAIGKLVAIAHKKYENRDYDVLSSSIGGQSESITTFLEGIPKDVDDVVRSYRRVRL
jgi:hypothetical protein